MNDFIVWDKCRKGWIDESYPFFINSSGFLCIQRNDKQMVIENDCEIFKPIGLKDTEGNKIYADCSIVEFSVCSLEPFSKKKQIKRIGKVRYCNSTCAYEIVVVNMSRIEYYDFSGMAFEISDIKIIDTIQENKLGLIK